MTPSSWSRVWRPSASKLKYYADQNFLRRRLPAPVLQPDRYADTPPVRAHDWQEATRSPDTRLERSWSDLVLSGPSEDDPPARPRDIPRRKRSKGEAPRNDLPLFADLASVPAEPLLPPSDDDRTVQFPGLRL